MSYGGYRKRGTGNVDNWRGGNRNNRGRGSGYRQYNDDPSYHGGGSSYRGSNKNSYYETSSNAGSSYSSRNSNYSDYTNESYSDSTMSSHYTSGYHGNIGNNGHNSYYQGSNQNQSSSHSHRGNYNNNNYSSRGHYNNNNNSSNYHNNHNNHNNQGGGYNNNSYHRNNGHYSNHHNNRGRGGGRGGRGGGRGGKSSDAILRYHDTANDGLNRQVMVLNKDHPGPQQIRVLKYNASHWEAVESLTRGYFYYHNRVEKSQPIRKSKPQELKDRTPVKTEYRRYTVSYAQRPKEWPTNMPVVILKTNSFQVRGKILETEVHQFEVTFEPAIKSEHVQLREKVVLGSSLHERRKNYELLRLQFGEFQFDNHALYSMGTEKPKGPVVFENLHSDYRVTFHCIDSFRLSDPTIPIQQQEALLNIFNRKRLQKTGFSRIGRGWYKKGNDSNDDGMQEISIPSNSSTCPDVNIIHGFECSMRILPKNGNRQLTVFKADLSHKLVERLTLHDRLLLMKRQSSNETEFRLRTEKELKRRHFLLSYNKRNLQIHGIDWEQNENSLFELQTGGKISYKQYLQQQYKIKSPKHEICVIKDKGGAAFLGQHIRLTITSKQTDAVYDEVLNWVNPRTDKRLHRIENFVQHINTTHLEERRAFRDTTNNKNKNTINTININNNNNNKDIKSPSCKSDIDEKLSVDFEIDEESLTTPAILLTMPRIIIQGERGPLPPQPVDKVKYFQTKGFLGNVKRMTQWGVVYESKYEKSYQQFERAWECYIKKRDFDPIHGPVLRPSARPIEQILDESQYCNVVRRGDQFLVVILPDGIRGSEVKAKFTKMVQQQKFPCPVLVQCIQASTCRKTAACLGTFDDIMIKFGNVIYSIDPMMPHSNDYIDPLSSWVVGIDVSHVRDKPSVVMISLSRSPFEGSLKSMHFLAHLNPSRKEIVAFANMVSVFYEALKEAYIATKNEKKKLPHTIWVFRDGVADGQIQELFTKEVVGIQRALTMFRENNKLKQWRPSLEYVLCNKNTIDRFGLLDQNTGLCRSLDKPCVIYAHILSDRLWDFIIFPYHYRKHPDRTKGVRYIVLVDGLKLAEKKGAAIDLFQFIFGLTYMFAFCLPFPLGGTAQPAPIVYAKHYAESFSQTILSRDRSLNDLQTNKELQNRPHIVTNVLLEKQA